MSGLLDPVVLFFVLGFTAGLLKSDLRLPAAVYEALSAFLLAAIGLKGGVELARCDPSTIGIPVLGTLFLGIVIPLAAFSVLRATKRFSRADAAALAAHYGSVSAVTFAVAQSFLLVRGVPFEPIVTVLLVVLEIPAIAVGVALYKAGGKERAPWGKLGHEVFCNRSVLLLVGGLAIGAVSGEQKLAPISAVFFGGFKGALAFFLMEMGVAASQKLSDLRKVGTPLVVFAFAMPLAAGTLGAMVGTWTGLSVGGATLLAVLAGSASYIAAPAACRVAIPEANPSLYVTASLGLTFPFNVVAGIPIYHALARWMAG